MIHFEGHILATDEALEHLDKINIKFIETNMDLINFEKVYTVRKVEDTSGKSPVPNKYSVMRTATFPNLVVMQNPGKFDFNNIMLALYFVNIDSYFRSSPIKNVRKKGKVILVETENSIYELTESK